MDFWVLPPEINSLRIITGPGSAPLITAAMGWTNLAAELNATSAGWQSIIGTTLGSWQGPSSIAMLGAATSHIAWLTQASIHAELSAAQAHAAALAYEMTRATMVPLPMVTANRVQLMILIATNILGQNTAAIAATEAQYMAMWAQDIAAMSAYQASSTAATAGLPKLTPAVQAGNPATAAVAAPQTASTTGINDILNSLFSGLFGSGGFLDNSTTTGQLIQSVISSGFPLNLIQLFMVAAISQSVSQLASNGIALHAPLIPSFPVAPSIPPIGPVTAIAKAGRPLGGLGMSVPPSWARVAQPEVVETTPPLVRPLSVGRGFMPAPIPMAITARQQPGGKAARGQSVEDSELLKTVRFTPGGS